MYIRHFAFTQLPFENDLVTDQLFESNAHRKAEARLKHLVELRGIGLLTGEVGAGKTTVCRHVTANLCRLCLVNNPSLGKKVTRV